MLDSYQQFEVIREEVKALRENSQALQRKMITLEGEMGAHTTMLMKVESEVENYYTEMAND
jgi:hypothetical protein